MGASAFRRHRAPSAFRKPLLSNEARVAPTWVGDALAGIILVAFIAASFGAASIGAHLLKDVHIALVANGHIVPLVHH